MISGRQFVSTIAVCGLAGILAACASVGSTPEAKQSGFLRDYSELSPGGKGEAQLGWVNSTANFSAYDKILMDPITVYAVNSPTNLNGVPKAELQSIIDYFDVAVRAQLSNDYQFVDEGGPRTMRLRIAVTEAKGANVALSTASVVVPGGTAINVLQKAITGAATGVGRAAVEMEIVDSQTGDRLAAAVDARAGSKLSSFSKWQGVQDAYDYWAERLKIRLAELRSQPPAAGK